MTLEDFETLVLTQRPASVPWAPVSDYSFEARKAIEGEHPRLILDVFRPDEALDVGCGFNYLARLVNELAGRRVMRGADKDNPNADTIDFDIRDHVRHPYRRYDDLVVCREVLEHLTVREIRKAIRHLCQLSKRFLYITTRFNEQPESIWHVLTRDDLDPTHISLLPKELLRSYLVEEGFQQRADLEQRMDWQHKGRCLVYERA